MIDLHSHLLPGVDDGAQTLECALDLARMAVSDGITHMVLTPHLHIGRFDNEMTALKPVFIKFRHALKEAKIPLTISIAGEVRITDELLTRIPEKRVPFLGKWKEKKVLLLELPHSHIPPGSDKLIKWLLGHGILPMIAHPERNKEILRNFDRITPFVEMGCLFQITAMSMTGEFGEVSKECAIKMLEKQWVTVLATDAHNSQYRPPILSKAYEAAKVVAGELSARQLVLDHPRMIAGL